MASCSTCGKPKPKCGCAGPVPPTPTVSLPPGVGQTPPSPFCSTPRVKYVPTPTNKPPTVVVAPEPTTPSTCGTLAPEAPSGGKAREPFSWKAVLRLLTCAPVGRLLVSVRGCFLHFFNPEQSGPVQFSKNTGQIFAGPLHEIAQVTNDAAIIERGYLPMARAEQRVVDGKTVWCLVYGTQVINYTGSGRLTVIDVDENGQIRLDLLTPPSVAAAATTETILLGYKVVESEGGCVKNYDWVGVQLPPQPGDPAITLTEGNIGDYTIQVWKDGVPHLANIPSNWFNE